MTEASKNPEQAKLLCLNAINHAPDNYSYIEGYVNLVMGMNEKLRVEDLNQARSVVEVALYQIPAEKISNALSLLNRITDKQDAIALVDKNKALAALQNDIKTGFDEAKSVQLAFKDGRISNLEALKNKIEKLQELRGAAPSSDKISDAELLKAIDKELNATAVIFEIGMKIDMIENCLANARNSMTSQDTLPAMASSLQTASGVLSQVWGNKIDAVPEAVLKKIQAQSKEIESLEKDYLKKKAAPATAKIDNLLESIQKLIDDKNKKFTERINAATEMFKQVNSEFSNVNEIETRNNLQNKLNKVAEKVVELNKKRYQAYQEWVVLKCQNALKRYQSLKRVDEVDATSIFDAQELSIIKQDLLIPEVSSIYNDIIQKLYAEMTWAVKAKYEKNCAIGVKKSLEDF